MTTKHAAKAAATSPTSRAAGTILNGRVYDAHSAKAQQKPTALKLKNKAREVAAQSE